MTTDSDYSKNLEKLSKSEISLNKFKKLLDELKGDGTSIDPKLKNVWLEIYDNAMSDREYSKNLHDDLSAKIKGNVELHGLYGIVLSKYLERMCRSNDQLIRLAEMVERSVRASGEVDPNSVYEQIDSIKAIN